MNKLCYIEVCTNKMDIPSLANDVLAKFKNKKNDKDNKNNKELSVKKNKQMDFSTKIHESLREV